MWRLKYQDLHKRGGRGKQVVLSRQSTSLNTKGLFSKAVITIYFADNYISVVYMTTTVLKQTFNYNRYRSKQSKPKLNLSPG